MLLPLVLRAIPAAIQATPFTESGQPIATDGWGGFTDLDFMLEAALILALAAVLGAVIGYHPRAQRTADTVEEAEAPKVYITYATTGALIGLMVVQYGLVVGFAVFGIGGLIRFRTTLSSAAATGRLILVTLIGLSAGLDLPHLAVLATVFAFVLIYVLEARTTHRLEIQGLSEDQVAEAEHAYGAALESAGYRVINRTVNISKGRITLVFQTSSRVGRREIERRLEAAVAKPLRGVMDWEAA